LIGDNPIGKTCIYQLHIRIPVAANSIRNLALHFIETQIVVTIAPDFNLVKKYLLDDDMIKLFNTGNGPKRQ